MELIEDEIAKVGAASGDEILLIERQSENGIRAELAEMSDGPAEPLRRAAEQCRS